MEATPSVVQMYSVGYKLRVEQKHREKSSSTPASTSKKKKKKQTKKTTKKKTKNSKDCSALKVTIIKTKNKFNS